MKNDILEHKNIIANLIDRLRSDELLSEEQEDKIIHQLDDIISDPKWMEYIYWSDDYIRPDGSFCHDEFFEKISDYEKSDEYQQHQYAVNLANDLIHKNFSQKNEMHIVNELNQIADGKDWLDWIFVSKACLNQDGTLNEKHFIIKLFYQP